ncbi:HYR domain-containing protein [Lewinella sp. W8]|uniref:HYR domain-containing protein n=1 Tax=Lewinella sp. W8 TaxID=2528208 RepID=UPI0010679437|nr:HYR domain-containing protein [Lewinella sp. W8]MTB50068.1 HYR domain-containing protein [Lewinella sp. W8]
MNYLHSLRLLSGLFFVVLAFGGLSAQVTQDFSTSTPGSHHYVDPLSPFTEHILPATMAPQTQPNAATMGAIPGYQVTYTPTRDRDAGGGLTDGELFGVVDYTVAPTPDNDMGSLTIDIAANPPPSGNNNIYVLQDPDGLATLRFNPVVVDGSTMFSMSYIVANTSYENGDGADDRIEIYLINTATGDRTMLFSAINEAIPTTEVWTTLTADLSGLAGATVQLVIEFDTNASAEEMAIDNIIFSTGVVEADWPECTEPSLAALGQSPATVCPGVPFRMEISGSLGNATEWVIYSDAEGTQEVARTSSDQYDFFGGAELGTTYYVRGEGGCASSMDLTALALTIDDGDCEPNAPPSTSFEDALASQEDYVDTGNPVIFRFLENNQGQPTVTTGGRGKELGFITAFAPTRLGTSGEAGLTDGDALGVTDDPDAAFTDGEKGFVFEDTDGLVSAVFAPIDIAGLSGVTVSFDYFIRSTSYESSSTGTDRFTAVILNESFGLLEEIFDAAADGSGGFPDLTIGQWTTVTYTITESYDDPIRLTIQADLDAGSERIFIDNVSFSAGTVVCQDEAAPVIACPEPISVDVGADCMATAEFTATATDDCSSTVTITYSQDSGTNFPVGVTTVTATATDETGKSSTCTFDVTVNDVTAPTLDCPEVTVKLDSTFSCDFVVISNTDFDPIAADNCEGVTLLSANGLSSLVGDTIFKETTELTWTATDASGLTATCTQQINVIVPPSCFPTSVTEQDPSDFANVVAIPNPFREAVTINFELPFMDEVGIDVLDVSGRVVQSARVNPNGDRTYSWRWDATDAAGGRAAAGMYFVRLRARGQLYTKRIVLTR